MPRAVLPLLLLVFFLSGFAALIFETLWFREAALTFGGSVWATALVLSSFMAGLAIGNGLAARFGQRVGRPIRLYAALEFVVGCAGLWLVWTLPSATHPVAGALRPFSDSVWLLRVARFGAAFLLLLAPAVAMGATLPLLVRAFVGQRGEFGRVLGRLYGVNTLGAVLGAVTSELVWIPAAGVIGSGCVAAGVNALCGGLALVAARFAPPVPRPRPASPLPGARLGLPSLRLLAAALLSGATLLALEVVWFRALVLFMPGTSAVFAWMLGVVLTGIALGGLLAAGLLRLRADLARAAAVVALLSGAATLATYALFPVAAVRLASPNVEHPLAIVPLAAALMLPTSLLSGLLFTWLGKLLHAELGSDVRAAGLLTLANTLGAMVGPLAASFLLLPRIGIERSVWLLGLGYGAVAACATSWSGLRAENARRLAHVAALGLFAWSVLVFPFGSMRSLYQWYIAHSFGSSGAEQLIAVREGVNETIGVTRASFLGEPYYYRLVTDGYSMSGTRVDGQRYMSLFAFLPYALHAQPRDALLISYGVGVTARALLEEPRLETLDVVDISRDILEVSLLITGREHSPLRDPRVRVHLEDGRYFMETTDRSYDVITGEPPPPAAAGVVNLYTREYFELLRSRLRRGGIASYWLPVWQLAENDAKAIVGAFCAAFPDCSLWEGTPIDWILLGTREARGPLEEGAIRRQWEGSRGESLRAIGIESPELLAALFLADAPFLKQWVGEVPPLVDNWPRRAPRWNPQSWDGGVAPSPYASLLEPLGARRRFEKSAFVARMWPETLRERSLPAFAYQGIVREHQLRPGARLRVPELHRLLTETDFEVLPLWLLDSDADKQRIVERASGDVLRTRATIAYHRGARALARRDYAAAARLLDEVYTPLFPRSPYFSLYALAMAGRLDEARERARAMEGAADPGLRPYWSFMQATFGVEPSVGWALEAAP